jgi:O-glycosyl hydrolase
LTEAISQMRDNGVPITAAGILNEPNDRPIRFTNKQWPIMVKTLRFLLDNRGLRDVAIIAPEAASGDKWAEDTFDAIASDKDAWGGLGGVATHTYNMGATAALLEKSRGKPYWQTESSTPGPEADDATAFMNAATTGARALSDLNHGVTHWLWFIGYERGDPTDNGVRLIRYDASRPDGDVHFTRKYFVLQQLSQAFANGAAIYPCESSTENSMTFTYGRKPALLAAAAKNADGSWAIAVQNYTSDRFAGLKDEDRAQAGPDRGRTITVTIHLPAVENATFAVRRTNETVRNAEDGQIAMKKGKITVPVDPLELVTLRAVP